MSTPRTRSRLGAWLAAAALAAAGLSALTAGPAAAAPPAATYTIGIGSTGSFANPDDTPASPFIDKNGTFYYQSSHSLYGATDSRSWQFYTGSDFTTATAASIDKDGTNPDTTAFCNNSPTGVTATAAPSGSGYAERNYCDLLGVWVDPDTGNWYGLVHNEFTPEPFGDGMHYDAIDYAESTNQGKSWTIEGHAITSPYSTARGDTTAFPNQTYDYGDGDPRLYVDYASGYFYVYYGSRIEPKGGVAGSSDGLAHVARAPISGKMATGTWQKYYDGSWSQPGVGGLESNLEPVTSAAPSGYTAPGQDYNPANTGDVDQQIAAGQLPSKSPLFVMNITYDAYLGLYIGEPEVVDQSSPKPQQFYVTDNLATQKWYLIGDSGSYTSDSWYRWFLDGQNLTSSTVVGETFRSYCAIACASSDGEYANVTISSSAPAASPFDPGKTYQIAAGDGQVLAQASGGPATASQTPSTGNALQDWTFQADGDGSYRIANASTGQLLGVASTAASTRAWGTKPTVTAAAGSGGPSVGQQWWIIADTSASSGAATGTYRLVNRYSGLVLGLSSGSGATAETTPARYWTNTTGNAVGGSRAADQQTMTITAVGSVASLNGTHTLATGGMALDDPNWSTADGTQLDTWSVNGGANQNWTFARQPDGSYQIENAYSNLCMDDDGGATTPGTAVIQWPCTGNANQHWTLAKLSGGAYTVTNVNSGLLLTTSSTADGGLVTQQANTGAALQEWTLG